MTDLEYKPFGKLLSKIVDNRGKTCPTADSGIPLIATNCISNDYLYPRHIKVRYVDDDTFSKWFRGHPEPDDMIFVTKGSPGRVAWVPNPVGFCIAQDMVAIKPDSNKVYPKYLFAALRSKIIQQEIEGLHVGTLIPHFKKGDFNNLVIPLPSNKMQQFIGNQYFDFSLKIELLHRQKQTLEAMAETLFRQWFVEGAQKDWEDGKISDLFLLQRGFDLPRKRRIAGSYPIFAASGHCGNHDKSKVKAPGVTTGRSGTLGKVFLIMEDFWPLNTSLFIKEFRIGTPFFSYFLLKTLDLEGFNAGSAVPTLNRNHVHEHNITIPPRALIKEFENLMIPSFKKIEFNKTHIRTLEKLIATLLPKLMNGEVRVKF